MFKIDFLKNQGLPRKSRTLEVGLFTSIAVISVLVLCLLCVWYFHNSSTLRSKEKSLAVLESMLQKTSGKSSLKLRIKKNLSIYDECYFEVANSIGRYVQWTPVLRELANHLPPSMLLNELSVIRTIKKKKVASIRNPRKKVSFEIVSRILKSDVYDFMPDANNTAVKDYLDIWCSSQVLESAFKSAYLAKSSNAEYEDSKGKSHAVRNYIIDSQLKSQEIADTKL